jgi:hypothetical protein
VVKEVANDWSWDGKDRKFHAMIRNIKRDLLGTTENLSITIAVDEQNKLRSIETEKIFTGP